MHCEKINGSKKRPLLRASIKMAPSLVITPSVGDSKKPQNMITDYLHNK